MLARLQQLWVFILLLLAISCAAAAKFFGTSWWVAAGIGVATLHLHAFVLAIEFMALSRIDPGAGIPRPDARALIGAWWGEVWTGFRVFCWRQPFRSEVIADALPEGTDPRRRPVLLVHGFVCNRGLWNPWMQQLSAAGVPYVAVNLEPVFGSIDAYVPTIETAIRQIEARVSHKPLIVAHSMGGLAVRAWMATCGGDARVHSVVTIGSPHAGTRLADAGVSRNARQMRRGSGWLNALREQETAQRRALFTCYYSHCDNIVVPASTAALGGADNRHVPGVAHVHLAFQPQVFADVLERTAVDTAGLSAQGRLERSAD